MDRNSDRSHFHRHLKMSPQHPLRKFQQSSPWYPMVHMHKVVYTDRISLSQTPKIWGCCRAEAKCYLLFSNHVRSPCSENSRSSLSRALKFVPWCEYSSACVRANKKEPESIAERRSKYTEQVVRHLKIMPHLFSIRCLTFISMGLKQSIPVG